MSGHHFKHRAASTLQGRRDSQSRGRSDHDLGTVTDADSDNSLDLTQFVPLSFTTMSSGAQNSLLTYSAAALLTLSDPIVHRGNRRVGCTKVEFRRLFGASPSVTSTVWGGIEDSLPEGGKPEHLLWALLFLKQYSTEPCNKSLTGATRTTLRHWTWPVIKAIAGLKTVSN